MLPYLKHSALCCDYRVLDLPSNLTIFSLLFREYYIKMPPLPYHMQRHIPLLFQTQQYLAFRYMYVYA